MSGEKSNSVNLKEQGDHQGQLKKHFAQCYEISYLSDGYSIPVGGSIFSDEQDVTLIADFGLFNDFFLETHELVGKYNLAELHNWLKEQDIEIDAPLFARACYALHERSLPGTYTRARAVSPSSLTQK